MAIPLQAFCLRCVDCAAFLEIEVPLAHLAEVPVMLPSIGEVGEAVGGLSASLQVLSECARVNAKKHELCAARVLTQANGAVESAIAGGGADQCQEQPLLAPCRRNTAGRVGRRC